jgi:hypothetical protein
MQETLVLQPTTEYHIDNINLDYAKLSASEEFGEKLESFNSRYAVELVATKGARWQPGTYNKLKSWVPNILYPHWKRRRGANSINKLLQQEEWSYNNFKKDLHNLDDMLFHYRKDGLELYADNDIDEAKILLKEIIDLLSTPTPGINFNISPVPYFGRTLRYMEYNNVLGIDNRLFPMLDKDMNITGSYNHETYDTMTAYEEKRMRMVDNEPHPGKWYINVLISLKDITIKITNRDMNREYGSFPYGDIIVGFTVDLMTLCTNYKRIQNKQPLIKTNLIGNGTTVFPYYGALQHPYIYRVYEGGVNRNWFTSYGNGNTCFGDLTQEINRALLTGNLKMLKTYLKIWSSSYTSGSTSPLNSPQLFHFGKPKDWDANQHAHIATDKSICQNQIQLGTDKEEFKNKFCSNCELTGDCRTYTKLTFLDLDWKTSGDKHWRTTFDQLCDYFDGDLDIEMMNQIFNDLYYFVEIVKSPIRSWRKILKIFMLRDSHSYFIASDVYAKTEWEDFQNDFLENPMHNLKALFLRAERAWILEHVHHDSADMYTELVSKIQGKTFEEACEILPTRTIEDNHYSWLYAVGSISERGDYKTYYQILNKRKEGLRFGD